MEKNTIWAIVLSTVVICAAFVIQPILFPTAPKEEESVTEEITTVTETENQNFDIAEDNELAISKEDENVTEETYTVKTDTVEVVLTNKGGDIISYKLLKHNDIDTNDAVQLADNVSEINRACAIAIGDHTNEILNDCFTTEKIDDYTYLFKKNVYKNGCNFTIGKKYTFKPGEYVFKLDVLIHSNDGKALNFNDVAYTIRTSPQLGPHFDSKKNRYENRQFLTYNGNNFKKVVLGTNQFKEYEKPSIWDGIGGKYFEALIIPVNSEIINSAWYSTKTEVNNYANAQAFVERKSITAGDVIDSYYMYYGPRNDKDLKRYNVAENNGWGMSGYKINESIQTSGWLNWLEVILKWCLENLNKLIHNWGISIIVMTIIIKLLLFPLNRKQSLSSIKMQDLQPKMQAIQNKYKNDQQKMQAETAKLYKEAGYNPASGCLPMLIQFLLLWAMFNLFNNYFEFRGSVFIPGWIPDLSVGDSVYTLKFNIPLLGNQIRIMPVIYVISQLIYGKITQYGQPQTGANQQNAATMKVMLYVMPLMFFFMFYNASSGLLLYWTVGNIFTIFQQLIINKEMSKVRNSADTKKKTTKKNK